MKPHFLFLITILLVVESVNGQIQTSKTTWSSTSVRVDRNPKVFQVTENSKQMLRDRSEAISDHFRSPPGDLYFQAPLEEDAQKRMILKETTVDTDPAADFFVENVSVKEELKGQTLVICEPSVASTKEGSCLLTGNIFAAFRSGTDKPFKFVNPAEVFPNNRFKFCCDQVVLYDQTRDMLIWFLQYRHNGRTNIFRVAVSVGDDIKNFKWRYYDFSPESLGGWTNEWFDYPALALTDNNLFITSNSFDVRPRGPYKRCVAVRIPLEKMKEDADFSPNYYMSESLFSLRPTQGATDTMYLGAHEPGTQGQALYGRALRVIKWKEDENRVDEKTVMIDPWFDRQRVSFAKGDRLWLNRCDGRIFAGWVKDGYPAFGWTAPRDNKFSVAHSRFAIVNFENAKTVAQPHLYNPEYSFAYPSVSVSKNGAVGISVAYGGNGDGPNHAVGHLNEANEWKLFRTVSSTHGPRIPAWGDYLCIAPDGQDENSFVSVGFSQQGSFQEHDVAVQLSRFKVPGSSPGEGSESSETANDLNGLKDDLESIQTEISDTKIKLDDALKKLQELIEQQKDGLGLNGPALDEVSVGEKCDWTFMVFMNGDNNLEEYGIKDFEEMAAVGSIAKRLNIVVQFDRTDGFSEKYGDWEGTKRYLVGKGMTPTPESAVQDLGEVDMGSGQALEDFVSWSLKKFPADRYALIIWDHGDGFKDIEGPVDPEAGVFKAVSHDSSSGNYLYNREIQDHLSKALDGEKLDIIGFDACLMATIETGYAMSHIADLMIASEELEPVDGWDYARVLSGFKSESPKPKAFAKHVVQSFGEYYATHIDGKQTTLSALELGSLVDAAHAFDELMSTFSSEKNAVTAARSVCQRYGQPNAHLIDLIRLLKNVSSGSNNTNSKTRCDKVRKLLQASVLEKYVGSERMGNFGSHGISIYFPQDKKAFNWDPDSKHYLESNTFFPVQFLHDFTWDNFLVDLIRLERN